MFNNNKIMIILTIFISAFSFFQVGAMQNNKKENNINDIDNSCNHSVAISNKIQLTNNKEDFEDKSKNEANISNIEKYKKEFDNYMKNKDKFNISNMEKYKEDYEELFEDYFENYIENKNEIKNNINSIEDNKENFENEDLNKIINDINSNNENTTIIEKVKKYENDIKKIKKWLESSNISFENILIKLYKYSKTADNILEKEEKPISIDNPGKEYEIEQLRQMCNSLKDEYIGNIPNVENFENNLENSFHTFAFEVETNSKELDKLKETSSKLKENIENVFKNIYKKLDDFYVNDNIEKCETLKNLNEEFNKFEIDFKRFLYDISTIVDDLYNFWNTNTSDTSDIIKTIKIDDFEKKDESYNKLYKEYKSLCKEYYLLSEKYSSIYWQSHIHNICTGEVEISDCNSILNNIKEILNNIEKKYKYLNDIKDNIDKKFEYINSNRLKKLKELLSNYYYDNTTLLKDLKLIPNNIKNLAKSMESDDYKIAKLSYDKFIESKLESIDMQNEFLQILKNKFNHINERYDSVLNIINKIANKYINSIEINNEYIKLEKFQKLIKEKKDENEAAIKNITSTIENLKNKFGNTVKEKK